MLGHRGFAVKVGRSRGTRRGGERRVDDGAGRARRGVGRSDAAGIDVLACSRGSGCLRLIAAAENPEAIRAMLAAVAAPAGLAGRAPPPGPALNTGHATASGD
jgi:hypothetical protein